MGGEITQQKQSLVFILSSMALAVLRPDGSSSAAATEQREAARGPSETQRNSVQRPNPSRSL